MTADVALLLAGWLQTGEQVVVYGTAIDPTAQPELSRVFRGSRVRQVPQSILNDYRRQSRVDSLEWVSESELDVTADTDDSDDAMLPIRAER